MFLCFGQIKMGTHAGQQCQINVNKFCVCDQHWMRKHLVQQFDLLAGADCVRLCFFRFFVLSTLRSVCSPILASSIEHNYNWMRLIAVARPKAARENCKNRVSHAISAATNRPTNQPVDRSCMVRNQSASLSKSISNADVRDSNYSAMPVQLLLRGHLEWRRKATINGNYGREKATKIR